MPGRQPAFSPSPPLTPPLGNILEGLTRETILEICGDRRIPCREAGMTVYDLVTADEVFETATLSEVSPIVSIDGRRIGTGRTGPMTSRLHEELRRVMASGVHSRTLFR